MQGYQSNSAYLGAAWAGQANQRRKQAQSYGQMASQNAAQQSQYNLANAQFQSQQGANQMRQRDSMFRFGINALTGLMR